MKEIADGVWAPGATPSSHTFLIHADGAWVLVDSGYPWQKRRLLAAVRSRTDHLDGIVLTHHDLDHIGGAALLQKSFDAPVFVHRLDRPYFDGAPKEPPAKNRMARLAGFVTRRPADIRVLEEMPFAFLKPVWLPGHTPGHTVFCFRDLVFSGDMFSNRTGEGLQNLWGYHGRPEETADSLKLLADMSDVTFLPAHGEAVRASGNTRRALLTLSAQLQKSRV